MISCWMPWERSISRRVLEPLKSIYHKIEFFHQSNSAFYAPIFLLTDKSQYLKIVVHDGSVVMKDFVTYQSWSRHLKITQRWKRFQNYHSLEQAFGRRFNCNRHLAFKLHLKETILTTQFCLKNVARLSLFEQLSHLFEEAVQAEEEAPHPHQCRSIGRNKRDEFVALDGQTIALFRLQWRCCLARASNLGRLLGNVGRGVHFLLALVRSRSNFKFSLKLFTIETLTNVK